VLRLRTRAGACARKVFFQNTEQTRVFFVTAKAPRFALSFFFFQSALFFLHRLFFLMKTLNLQKKVINPKQILNGERTAFSEHSSHFAKRALRVFGDLDTDTQFTRTHT